MTPGARPDFTRKLLPDNQVASDGKPGATQASQKTPPHQRTQKHPILQRSRLREKVPFALAKGG